MDFRKFFNLLVILTSFAVLATAQIGTATITGLITDPSGAVIPQVDVRVVNTETGFVFTGRTNTEGLYRIQSLQPGPYSITYQATGFKQLVRDGIMLRTGDVLPVNVRLELGNLAESVEVTGAAPLIETETSSIGSVVAGGMMYQLPMYQRFVNASTMFVPGVSVGTTSGSGSVSGYNIAGQRSSSIGAFSDGVSINDATSGTSTTRTVQNSVAEVKVLTTVLPAEYGHSGGGVVSIVKKTGTNELHGMASLYGRSRSMQHRNFFDKNKLSDPTPGNPNGNRAFFLLPDANIGGPVVLPKIYDGRNKTFFFFGWQKLIEKLANFQQFGTVPTDDMLAGDFSFNGLGNPLYDPSTTRQLSNGAWTRDPIPNKRVPLNMFNPVAQKIVGIHPWKYPNETAAFNANGPSGNLSYFPQSRTYFDDLSTRIDHQFSSNVKINGSWGYDKNNGAGRPANIRLPDFDTNSYSSPGTNQLYSLGGSWIINATTFNDARFGWYRRRSDRFVPSYEKDYGKILGIPNISPALMPALGSGDQMSPNSIYGLTISGPRLNILETLTFRDDLTRMAGTHSFRMGYEWMRFRANSMQINQPSGAFYFDNMTAGLQPDGNVQPRTGNTFAGFLLGYVRQAQFDMQLANWLPRSTINSVYFQDDWKAARNLTVNWGVRYSTETPFTTKYGQMSNFDPAATDALTGKPGGIVHPTTPLNRRDTNNIQPRLGVAWQPASRIAVRSGFAIYTVDVKFPTSRGQFQEYVAQANYQQLPGDPRPIYAVNAIPSPVKYDINPNGTSSAFFGTNYGSRSQEWWDSNLRNPYSLNWNLSVQYELSKTYVVELMYQGSSGIGLIEQWNVNTFPIDYGASDPALRAAAYKAPQNYRPFPHFGDISFRSNFGHSTYHGGTIKLERRFAQNLTFQTFLTLAKSLNSQDSDNSGSGVAPIQNRSLEKARAGYDRPKRYFNAITYNFPMGKGRALLNRGGWVNALVGGWQTAWMIDWESGSPLTFSFANSPYNYYPTWVGSRRADLVGKPKLRDNWLDMGPARFNQLTVNPVIDMSAFAYPAAFTVGNSGRNILGGPPKFAMDASLEKRTLLTEKRWAFVIRLDIHSVQKMLFNRYNFSNPTTSVDFQNPNTFGKITGNPSTSLWGGMPLMNLALQLSF